MTGKEVREQLLEKGIVLADLAEKLGISAQTLNSRLNARYFKEEYIKEIFDVTGITLLAPIANSGYVTYLLPMSAMGGSLTGFAAPGTGLKDCEKIISPIENVDFAITVYGESMTPEYPSGSRVLIKKINPSLFIEWGKVYVLDTPNGVIIKEVLECKGKEGYIVCHSINPKFADFEVPLSEIYGMYRVLMCLAIK